MRAHKFGGMACLRNSITRRHLFYNQEKSLSLDEILEYSAGRCIGKFWEVVKISLAENTLSMIRERVLLTEKYAVAWNMVRDGGYKK